MCYENELFGDYKLGESDVFSESGREVRGARSHPRVPVQRAHARAADEVRMVFRLCFISIFENSD